MSVVGGEESEGEGNGPGVAAPKGAVGCWTRQTERFFGPPPIVLGGCGAGGPIRHVLLLQVLVKMTNLLIYDYLR